METELIPFFVVLFVSVAASEFFRRLHLPWVVALIAGGIVAGPQALGWFPVTDTLLFFAEIGLIFLMFMAGLETKLNHARRELMGISVVALVNGLLPFGLGFVVASLMGLEMVPSLLIGIIFMSSSVAVVVPALEAKGILHNKIGRFIVSSTLIQDVLSLFLLSIVLQTQGFGLGIPLVPLYGLVVITFIALRWLVPKVNMTLVASDGEKAGKDLFQKEIRLTLVILVGVVILFELLGLHPIIGAFLAGLILSDSVSSERLYAKLRTVSYGIFIPVFFIMVGAQTDISVLALGSAIGVVTLIILLASLSSKYVSGFLAGRLVHMDKQESHLLAITSMPQLSTTLAVAFIGLERGLLSQEIVTALVILSVVSTLMSPLLLAYTDAKEIVADAESKKTLTGVSNPKKKRNS